MATIPRFNDGGIVDDPEEGMLPEDLEEGGEVTGPGGPTDDQVPAMLSPGEIVVPADSVEAIGAANLLALIDRTHVPSGKPAVKDGVEAHADGGEIRRDGNAYSAMSTIGPNASFVGGSAGGVTGDGSISDQSQSAAQRLADTSTTSSILAAQQPTQAYQPSSAAAAMSTPPQQNPALGDWTQRNAVRSAQVQASSIDPRTSAEGRQAMATLTGVGAAPATQRGTPRAQSQQAMAQLPAANPAAADQPSWSAQPASTPARPGTAVQQMNSLPRASAGGQASGAAQFPGLHLPVRVAPSVFPRPQVAAYADGGMVPPEEESNAIRDAAVAMSTLPAQQQIPQAVAAPVAAPAAAQAQFQKPSAAEMLAKIGETNASNPASPALPQAPQMQMAQDSWSARKAMQNAETTASSIHKPTAQRGQAEMARLEKQNAQENMINADAANLQTQNAGATNRAQIQDAGATTRTRMQEAWAARRAAAQNQMTADLAMFKDRGEMARTQLKEDGDTQRALLAADNKPAPGYRWKDAARTQQERIPGGPADTKYNAVPAQQEKDAQDIFSIISQATPLLQKATGSRAGNLADAVAKSVGVTTDGALNAGQLKVLEGNLIAKMPKMSGPQSDKDVEMYRQMAGNIGDPTIPGELKAAALNTLHDLHVKYLPSVSNEEEVSALPSGAYFKTPDGKVRRVP